MPWGWYRYPLKRPKNWQHLKKAKTKWYHQNDFTFPLFLPLQREKSPDQMLIYNKLINPDGKTRKVDKMYSINQKNRRKIKNLTKVTIINRKYLFENPLLVLFFPKAKSVESSRMKISPQSVLRDFHSLADAFSCHIFLFSQAFSGCNFIYEFRWFLKEKKLRTKFPEIPFYLFIKTGVYSF